MSAPVDKLGIPILVGSYIAYASLLGRSAALKVGRVLAIKEGRENTCLTVKSVDGGWDGKLKVSKRNGTLQFPDRVVVLSVDSVPQAYKDLLKQPEPEKALLTCQDCEQAKPDVKETTCPYDQDVYNKTTDVVLCADCEHERAMDI